MKKILFLVLAVIIIIANVSCTTATNPTTTVVDPTPNPTTGYYSVNTAGMTFQWKITGANIACKVSGPTTGWVSVAFNSAAKMDGSDYIIGYVTGGSTLTISDEHGSGHNHSADSVQNLTVTSGTESGGTTEILFTRALNTGDSQDKVLSKDMSLYIILAYGPSDNLTSMHSDYGAVQTILH
ncbi:MAG: DOMON domain-containing protein [bacterium]